MTLQEYIAQKHQGSMTAFAKEIGVSTQAVSRYIKGHRIPEPKVMREIVASTRGAVTPNDFFDPPSQEAQE